jgi:hypothetical protein
MDLHIEDKKFNFWDFPEKLSQLKKLNKINFVFSIYVYDSKEGSNIFYKSCDLEFIRNLNKIPDIIYVSKSKYYYWSFIECDLINKKILQDKNFIDYKGRDINKFDIEFSISYKDVYGSNNKSVIDRDIKLNKLFNK